MGCSEKNSSEEKSSVVTDEVSQRWETTSLHQTLLRSFALNKNAEINSSLWKADLVCVSLSLEIGSSSLEASTNSCYS